MKNTLGLFLLVLIFISCKKERQDTLQYVDVMIGTDATGNTYPGATLPFGAVQLSPDTYNDRCCSGYHYTDVSIIGFSHTHLSGTGCADFGDILIMPTVGKQHIMPGTAEDPDQGYRSRFTHDREEAYPGYYSVLLDDYQVKVELSTTMRVGFHKYTFPASEQSHIILDLEHDITGGDIPLEDCFIKVISDTEIEGFRHSRGWASNQYVYFVAQFSEPFMSQELFIDNKSMGDINEIQSANCKAIFNYSTTKDQEILVKVAISAVSTEGARKNLEEELMHWDFDATVEDAKQLWEEHLSKIKVKGGSEDQKVKFYTAFYHALLTPNLFMDVDGKYRGMDHQIYEAEDFNYYHVFSLWDTYRAVHPFFNILFPDENVDFVKTMLKQYEHTGLLPIWELAGCENNCMIGYHGVPVIADAYLKGNTHFDVEKAFEAMDASANFSGEGIPAYQKNQFIPRGATSNSVSKTLEYAYDDWCIAQLAKALGKEDKYQEYILRSQFYKNHFDKSTGLMRARYSDGTWLEPFDPLQITMLDAGDYTEANAWHYSFYIPHNIPNHIELMGGDEAYNNSLDTFFTLESEGQQAHSDFTGKFGQYAHGNEPSHHMPYLYNYCGKPWETQKLIRKTMNELYTTAPDGLCGNDDCGQLSCWYLFSAMGFYPVCPGQDMYVIGSPIFDEVSLELPNSKEFIIKTNHNSNKNMFIQSMSLNGQDYPNSYLKHSDLMKGGEMVFEMGDQANESWAVSQENRPYALEIEEEYLLPELGSEKVFNPYAKAESILFVEEMEIRLACLTEEASIYYTIDGSDPDLKSMKYLNPFKINTSTGIRYKAVKEGLEDSEVVLKYFYKSNTLSFYQNIEVEYLAPKLGLDCGGMEADGLYAPQYESSGKSALIDGVLGTPHFTDGIWQGFNGKDVTIIIDLKKKRPIKQITAGFLQNIGVWIFYPEQIKFSVSSEGQTFKPVAKFEHPLIKTELPEGPKYFTKAIDEEQIRYIKVQAKTVGYCPEWHEGSGGKSWIFMDEIIIE